MESDRMNWLQYKDSAAFPTEVITALTKTIHVTRSRRDAFLQAVLRWSGVGDDRRVVGLSPLGERVLELVAETVSPCLQAAREKKQTKDLNLGFHLAFDDALTRLLKGHTPTGDAVDWSDGLFCGWEPYRLLVPFKVAVYNSVCELLRSRFCPQADGEQDGAESGIDAHQYDAEMEYIQRVRNAAAGCGHVASAGSPCPMFAGLQSPTTHLTLDVLPRCGRSTAGGYILARKSSSDHGRESAGRTFTPLPGAIRKTNTTTRRFSVTCRWTEQPKANEFSHSIGNTTWVDSLSSPLA